MVLLQRYDWFRSWFIQCRFDPLSVDCQLCQPDVPFSVQKHSTHLHIPLSFLLSFFFSFSHFPFFSVFCKRAEVVVIRYRDFAQLVEMPVTTGWGWILLCCPFPRRRNCPLQPYGYQPFITFVRKGSDSRERETEYKLGFGPESTRFKPWLCYLLSK